MDIIQYESRYRRDFIGLNTKWIVSLFGVLEKEGMETFQNIETDIAKGGMIYFAIENDNVMANCMTKQIDNDKWEICKLAADDEYKKRGAGNAVFEKCMDYAIKQGAKRLFILYYSTSQRTF